MSFRSLKLGFVRLLGPIGGYRLVNAALQRSPRIFMYHGFTESNEARKLSVQAFDAHLQILATQFSVMTMGDLVRHLRAHGEAPPRAAVITVDDGHRDFLELAVPVLSRHGVRATLFATTSFVSGNMWLWPDRLEYALFRTRQSRLDIGNDRQWALDDDASRWRVWGALIDECTHMPHYDKEALIDEAIRALDVAVPDSPPAGPYAAVTVNELRALADEGFEIGAHTRRHPVLSRLPESELEDEIAGSKSQLEEWLQREVPSFCYPNGMPADISPAVKAHVRTAGFGSAVAAYFRHDVLADLFEIKRLSCGQNAFQFHRNVYGVEHVSSLLQQRFGI